MKVPLYALLLIGVFVLCDGVKQRSMRDVINEHTPDFYTKNSSRTSQETINVFIIPHTHDDVGWIIPIDSYYVQQVRYILDSCIQNLLDNPERKFTYVEIGYFERWWQEIPESRREQVRQLVRNGQLEFNLGGVTMNDEATTTYYEEINQMTEGARFLSENLGASPKSAWHIDPFGHSAVTASLWSQIGFSGFVLNRVPYWVKQQMIETQELEFVWRPSKSLGTESDIWIHVLDTWYASPQECAFNDNDGWNGIYVQDEPYLFDMNVDTIADNFVNMVRTRSSWYRHNNLLIPFGDDFAHREAYNSFVNMDKLINYVNSHPEYNVNVQYAHLSDYVNAVNKLGLTWSVYEGDFFPYNDDIHSYWTGYYTSRPGIKTYLRSRDAILQSAEQLYVFSNLISEQSNTTFGQLDNLRQANSIATHHDAVSGTETQKTMNDYMLRLQYGTGNISEAFQAMTQSILTRGKKPASSSFSDSSVVLSIYNPLAWTRTEYASVLLNSSDVAVYNSSGLPVVSQVNPVASYSFDDALYRLYFLVTIPPLSVETFTLDFSPGNANNAVLGIKGSSSSIGNEYLRLNLDSSTGRISQITNIKSNSQVSVAQDFYQYIPTSSQSGQASGAYIFRPDTNSVGDVGSTSSTNRVVSTINYPIAFPTTPYLVALPAGQSYNDTFSLTVRYSSPSSFRLNSDRVDQPGGSWGQDLQFDYLAITYDELGKYPGLQAGTIDVGPSSSELMTVSISYKAFSQIPAFVATPLGQDYDDTFTVTTLSVGLSSAKVKIYRNDGNAWSQDLQLNWIAIPYNTDPSQGYLTGTVAVSASGAENVVVPITNIPSFTQDPIILGQARSSDNNVYALTSRDRVVGSFNMNVWCVNCNSIGQLNVDYILFQRTPYFLPVSETPLTTTTITGPLVQEIQQYWRAGYAQTIRLYQNIQDEFAQNHIEVIHDIGPIDQGREFVTRYTTNLDGDSTVFTDDNGLEMQTRVYNETASDLVAGNYHPMVSRGYLQDTSRNLQFTLLSDSTHGLGGLNNGQMEVMLQRRCLSDDGRGVGEVLNETIYNKIQTSLWIILDTPVNSAELHRKLSIIQNFPLAITELPAGSYKPFQGFAKDLPLNVHLLSLQTVNETQGLVILRLQHIFEIDEHPVWSQPASVDLDSLFADFDVKTVTEMNLTGDQVLADVQKLHWNTVSKNNSQKKPKEMPGSNVITLNPMQIRTFLINLA